MLVQNDWKYEEIEQLALVHASAATPLRPARCRLLKTVKTDHGGHEGIACWWVLGFTR